MSTQINVSVDDGGLLEKAKVQSQANRWAKAEADARAGIERDGRKQRDSNFSAKGLDTQGRPLSGINRQPQNRVDEPAAFRRPDELIRVDARLNGAQREFFTSNLPYAMYDFDGETIDLITANSGGPFGDPIVRGSGGPDWTVSVDMSSIKPISGDFTVEAWSYWPTGQSENFEPFSLKASFNGEDSTWILWRYRQSASRLEISVQMATVSTTGIGREWWVPFPNGRGTWIHIAVVRQAGVVRPYVNGVLVDDSKIIIQGQLFDPTVEMQPASLMLANPQVYNDTSANEYWRFNQFVLNPKKARYSGASFAPPDRRL